MAAPTIAPDIGHLANDLAAGTIIVLQRRGSNITATSRCTADKTTRSLLHDHLSTYREAADYTRLSVTYLEQLVKAQIEPELGDLCLEDVDTCVMDRLKQSLPRRYSAKTINHYLSVIRAVLRFMWERGRLKYVPYVPVDSVPHRHARLAARPQTPTWWDHSWRELS